MLKKPLTKNRIIIACAGFGKTTHIIEEALKIKNARVAILTYTNENLDQIIRYFIEKAGFVPSNIAIQSWYKFLLREGVRPYQNYKTQRGRIKSIYYFRNSKIDNTLKGALRYRPEVQDTHYLTSNDLIYEDKVSKFICNCNSNSKGLVIKRLAKIYKYIFIDELQDLAGYDLQLLEELLKSDISITAVGDPRQATFSTNNSQKNKKYKKSKIYEWIKKKGELGEAQVEEKNESRRCNQQICDFADRIYPEYKKTKSKNLETDEHEGIFIITPDEIDEYVAKYNPVILRWSKNQDTVDFPAINIGLSKGRTYQRVLIFPTKPMIEYLITKDPDKAGDKSKLYVAITRARISVAFVVNKEEVSKKSTGSCTES